MRVAIVGASGRSGKAAVEHALAVGHQVTAVVRTATSAREGADERVADARDSTALAKAIAGADAVISCLGHRRDGSAGDETVLRDGAVALLEAMTSTGVSRVVAVSAAGAYVEGDDPLSRFVAKPLVARLFGGVFPDTRAMEDVLRSSSADWTVLRPSRLIPGTGRTPYRAGIDRAVWWHYNTTFDTVGRAAIDALSTPAWLKHAVFITE